nr:sialate O-acetylesterase [uncultured Carboxylicivirga sp.]
MKRILFIAILSTLLVLPVSAQIRLPKLISDGMVLQRDVPITIWGWASPDESIKIEFKNKILTTNADKNGKWQVIMPAQKPGGPFSMKLSGSNQINLNDILIGDVWLCSGQSNMELSIKRVEPRFRDEIKKINNTGIRHFRVPYKYDFNKQQCDLTGGQWKSATPENIMDFSAVAYFFANKIQQSEQVPIGIINSSLGGSPVEAWISEEDLKPFKDAYKELQRFKDSTLISNIEASDKQRTDEWFTKLALKDEGNKSGWSGLNVDDNNWKTTHLPGYWNEGELLNVNGAVWYRKTFQLSAQSANQPAEFDMGRIVDADSVFVNGRFVGTTSYQYPPRRYQIPSNILQEGENTIVVKVISQIGQGGFIPDKPYEIRVKEETISLAGLWKYKIGATMQPLEGPTFIRWKPAGLFNGMISPLTNYAMKGAVWYQGESNVDNADQYEERLTAMVKNWRRVFNHEDLPFIIIQLANYLEPDSIPNESNWAQLREAQFNVANNQANCASVNIIDLGEWNDIHPLNKKDVGYRVALAAEKVAYQKEVISSGPVIDGYQLNGSKVELSFKNIANGLSIKKGDKLEGFSIRDKNGSLIWANAKINEDKVIVWHENVTHPVEVRYAWANNPDKANLYNSAGLPTVPFRIIIK